MVRMRTALQGCICFPVRGLDLSDTAAYSESRVISLDCSVHSPMANHSVAQFYDESGQIFTESSCRPAPIGATWTYKTRGSPKEFENFIHSGSGCASLWEIATRTLLLHLDSVDSGVLTGIPAPILERIWKKIQKR